MSIIRNNSAIFKTSVHQEKSYAFFKTILQNFSKIIKPNKIESTNHDLFKFSTCDSHQLSYSLSFLANFVHISTMSDSFYSQKLSQNKVVVSTLR